MKKTGKAVAVIEEAAEDILRTFENVSSEALGRLRSAPIHGTDVLASVNTLTSGRGAEFIENLLQGQRDSMQVLSREPAIARSGIRMASNRRFSSVELLRSVTAQRTPATDLLLVASLHSRWDRSWQLLLVT